MKIFKTNLNSILCRIRLVFTLIVLLISILSLHSCKRLSKSGRASIMKERENNQMQPLIDTVSISPEVIGETTPEENAQTPINPDNDNIDPADIDDVSKRKPISQLFKDLQPGVFMVFAFNDPDDEVFSQGSGFFINSEGIGITNLHVLQGHEEYFIKTSDDEIYRIEKILESSRPEDNDYAIFQVESRGDSFKNLTVASTKTEIGEDVFAIGSPRGLENSLTKGSVSQYRNNNRIQIDATIEQGSSGGPLFNMNGEVIGITSAKLKDTDAALNFAIDIQALPYQGYLKKKRNNSNKISNTKDFYLPSTTFGETIAHTYYTLSYSNYDKQAEWVAYKITKNNFFKIERTNDYREDPKVKTGSAELYDYKRSGYDMGHLAPAASMSHNINSMSESFYLSNISPQEPSFNRGIWKRLEEKVRYWAYFNDSTFVVTGPVLKDPKAYIGKNKVTVPRSFYKTMLGYRDGKVKGIAFLMPNESSKKSIYSYVTSIDDIEKITGIDFYQNLEAVVQKRIEANNDLKKWALK